MRVLALIALLLVSTPASAACTGWKHCEPLIKGPKTYNITNNSRQKIGDLYDPGHNRRLQIRNNSRQIIGYIERDGDITNTSRQRVGSVESLGFGVD